MMWSLGGYEYKYLLTPYAMIGAVQCRHPDTETLMGLPFSDIANQNFQPGSNFLKSAANAGRKSFCTYQRISNFVAERVEVIPEPLLALQRAFIENVCEIPEEPVSITPIPRSPANQGSCLNQLYEVNDSWTDNSGFVNPGLARVFGPVTPYSREVGNAPNIALEIGYFSRGIPGTAPSPTPVRTIVRQQNPATGLRFANFNVRPINSSGTTVEECVRPTFPTQNSPVLPPSSNPTIVLPRGDGTNITLPVIAAPIVVAPNVKFEPKLVFDIGGITFEFNAGGVEFSVNPTIDAPVTINFGGTKLPTLPPAVKPVTPGGGGEDCCDEILDKLDDIEDLLDDIKECACEQPEIEWSSFNNVQTWTTNVQPRSITSVHISLNSIDVGKSFNVPGGREVSMVGWYAFGKDGFMGRRYSIQYRFADCVPDRDDYNEFTVSFYNGLTGNGKLRVKRRPEDLENAEV